MPRAFFLGYCPQFTLTAASTTLPAFALTNTDANSGLCLEGFNVSMAGTGAASVTVQIAVTNAGATAVGTSSAGTITQTGGRAIGALGISVCGYNYTAVRTTETYTVVKEFTMVNNQTFEYEFPDGKQPDCGVGVATFGSGFFVFFSAGTPVASTVDLSVARI